MMIPKGTSEPTASEHDAVPPDHHAASDQPKWRRDFPIAWGQDEWVTRRELVKFLVLTSGAFAAGHLWLVVKSVLRARAPQSYPSLSLGRIDELPVGGAKTFEYPKGSTPRLLVRTGNAEFVAYDQQCTHLSCPVVPAVKEGKLHCPCHNGWFDLQSGEPIAGPPQRPLPKIHLELRDGQVFAVGVEEAAT